MEQSILTDPKAVRKWDVQWFSALNPRLKKKQDKEPASVHAVSATISRSAGVFRQFVGGVTNPEVPTI